MWVYVEYSSSAIILHIKIKFFHLCITVNIASAVNNDNSAKNHHIRTRK